jgi:hypothetical protein
MPLPPVPTGTGGTVEQDVPCDPGYTRSLSPPFGCQKDVSSTDRQTGMGNCPPGQFWDGRQCRGSIGPMPGGYGTVATGGGGGAPTFNMGGFLRQVPLVKRGW